MGMLKSSAYLPKPMPVLIQVIIVSWDCHKRAGEVYDRVSFFVIFLKDRIFSPCLVISYNPLTLIVEIELRNIAMSCILSFAYSKLLYRKIATYFSASKKA
jgi:hypothetical protein